MLNPIFKRQSQKKHHKTLFTTIVENRTLSVPNKKKHGTTPQFRELLRKHIGRERDTNQLVSN